MAAFQFPDALLREQSLQWGLYHRTIDSGPTMSLQLTAVNATGGGLWRAKLTSVAISDADLELLWDATDARMDGGATPVIVPFCKGYRRRPWPIGDDGKPVIAIGVPFGDGAYFSDGSGFSQPVIMASIGADAALRETEITVVIAYGGKLVPGMHFSIEHPDKSHHLYRIAGIPFADEGVNAGTYTLDIRPPLRQAVTLGTALNFDHPLCRMVLATPDDTALDLAYRRHAAPTISFVEVG